MRVPLLALWLALIGTADAQPRRDRGAALAARAAFTHGVALMRRERWEDALQELRRSIALHPTQVALYDAALCLENLGRTEEALTALESLVAEDGAQATEERRAEYGIALERVRARMGLLLVTTPVRGAEVLVDGRAVGRTPMEAPLRVRPGPHRVEASAAGRTRVADTITLRAGELRTVALDLRAPEPPRRRAVEPPPRRTGPSPTWFWLSATTAGVATVTTALLGTLALAGDADFEVNEARTADDRDAGKRLVVATDIALAVAIATGAAAVVLWLLTDFEGQP